MKTQLMQPFFLKVAIYSKEDFPEEQTLKWKMIHHSTVRAILNRNGVYTAHNFNHDVAKTGIGCVSLRWSTSFQKVSNYVWV